MTVRSQSATHAIIIKIIESNFFSNSDWSKSSGYYSTLFITSCSQDYHHSSNSLYCSTFAVIYLKLENYLLKLCSSRSLLSVGHSFRLGQIKNSFMWIYYAHTETVSNPGCLLSATNSVLYLEFLILIRRIEEP